MTGSRAPETNARRAHNPTGPPKAVIDSLNDALDCTIDLLGIFHLPLWSSRVKYSNAIRCSPKGVDLYTRRKDADMRTQTLRASAQKEPFAAYDGGSSR